MPNSAPTTSTSSPAERSPPARTSTRRRLTGSPSTVKGCMRPLRGLGGPAPVPGHAADLTRVEGARVLRPAVGLIRGRARRLVRRAPGRGRPRVELPALLRGVPLGQHLWRPARLGVFQVDAEAQETTVPADPRGAGAVDVGEARHDGRLVL